ncbi:MAG TPA: hypothetical protein VMV18_06150, partial [bacterium]|nr:hypothetical protein [bacterium]
MRATLLVSILAAASLAGCGAVPNGNGTPVETPHARQGAGSIHAVVQSASGQTRSLSVEYAAAGLAGASGANDAGSLTIVGVFRDGRVDDSLDVETLSINVPLSVLPEQTG